MDELTAGSSEVRLFPNPADRNEKVMIVQHHSLPITDEIRGVEIVSITGQSVRTQQVHCSDCASMDLDITGLAPGMYLVNLIRDRDRVVKRLMIK